MLKPDARYHVTARTNRKEMIMDTHEIKDLFLEVVKRAKKKYTFRIENFCVMGNHFHFIIQPQREANLSAIMQWILSVFAMAWNRINDLTGHVWGERFFSRIIENLLDFIRVFKYIDANPVSANQVSDTRLWRHSGLFHARTGQRGILGDDSAWIEALFPTQFR